MNLRTVIWSGTLLALQPIAHSSGRKTGTVSDFRRETIFIDGKPLEAIPVLSGGTIRYSLRTASAKITQEWLSQAVGKLPFEAVHALHNGGALKVTGVEDVLTGERQAILRDLVPHMAIFGGVGGARAISGRLDVDTATPLARETAPLAQMYHTGAPVPDLSIYELVQKGKYGRFANIDGRDVQEGDPLEVENGGMIFWSQEVLPLGTRLLHCLQLNDVTPTELSYFLDVMKVWEKTARIGQQRRMGMGRIKPEYTREVLDLCANEAEIIPANWRDDLEGKQEQAKEALSWL